MAEPKVSVSVVEAACAMAIHVLPEVGDWDVTYAFVAGVTVQSSKPARPALGGTAAVWSVTEVPARAPNRVSEPGLVKS